jgi:alcohol dehydrogenase
VAYKEHGDPFVLAMDRSFPRPEPRGDQVLVQVYASSVNPTDFKFRRNPTPSFLIPKPKITGGDVAGVIVEVGEDVKNYEVGDRVAALLPLVGSQWGATAEYVAVKESYLCKIADSVTYEMAASMPLVGLTVMNAFEKLDKESAKGKKILIHAGAGGVGSIAIQYAKNVLGMDVTTTASKQKAEFLQRIGADHVIDYHSEDFTETTDEYDVILDPMSWKYESLTLNQGKNVLKKNGHYLNLLSSGWVEGKERTLGLTTLFNLIKHKLVNWISPGRIPKYDLIVVRPDGEKLKSMFDLLEGGQVFSVTDPQVFSIYEMSDAHWYLEKGYANGGKVVVRIMP